MNVAYGVCSEMIISSPPPADNIPSLENLLQMKWRDCKGIEHSFKLVELISSKWYYIGIRLDINTDTLENYKQKSDDNVMRLLYVFDHWIKNAGSLHYTMDWHGVLVLLRDIEMSTAAKELKEALKCQNIIVDH